VPSSNRSFNKRFRDTGLIGYLESRGAFKTLFGEKVGSRLNDVLFLAQNALKRFMGGHEVTDVLKKMIKQSNFLVILKIFNTLRSDCQSNCIKIKEKGTGK
jgi:hypothetical protein